MKGFTGQGTSSAESQSDSGNPVWSPDLPSKSPHHLHYHHFPDHALGPWSSRTPCTNGLKTASGTCTVLSSGFAPDCAIGNHVPRLTGRLGLFSGMRVELRQEAGVSAGMMEWSLEVTTEQNWKE